MSFFFKCTITLPIIYKDACMDAHMHAYTHYYVPLPHLGRLVRSKWGSVVNHRKTSPSRRCECVFTLSLPRHMSASRAVLWLILTGGIVPSAPFCILIDCIVIFSLWRLLHLYSSHPTDLLHFSGCLSLFLHCPNLEKNIWPPLSCYWWPLAQLILHPRYLPNSSKL